MGILGWILAIVVFEVVLVLVLGRFLALSGRRPKPVDGEARASEADVDPSTPARSTPRAEPRPRGTAGVLPTAEGGDLSSTRARI